MGVVNLEEVKNATSIICAFLSGNNFTSCNGANTMNEDHVDPMVHAVEKSNGIGVGMIRYIVVVEQKRELVSEEGSAKHRAPMVVFMVLIENRVVLFVGTYVKGDTSRSACHGIGGGWTTRRPRNVASKTVATVERSAITGQGRVAAAGRGGVASGGAHPECRIGCARGRSGTRIRGTLRCMGGPMMGATDPERNAHARRSGMMSGRGRWHRCTWCAHARRSSVARSRRCL